MKKALIIHGWDGRPNEPLHEYLKRELGVYDFEVTALKMPNPGVPVILEWVNKVKSAQIEDFDLVIGHSIGCQAVLRTIQLLDLKNKIPKIVLIAPWMKLDMQTVEEEGEEIIEIARPWMETPIDFDEVKNQVGEVVVIFSDDDPYVPLDQKNFFRDKLDAQVFIEKGQGHFTETDNFEKLQTETSTILP